MSANGVYAMSVITAITAQNTEEVTDVFELPHRSSPLSSTPSSTISTWRPSKPACCPRQRSSERSWLLKPQQIQHLVVDLSPDRQGRAGAAETRRHRYHQKELFPLALLVTPNVHEAQQLSGIEITSLADAGVPRRSFINSAAPMCTHQRGAICQKIAGLISSMTDGSSTSSKGIYRHPAYARHRLPLHPPSPHIARGKLSPTPFKPPKPISPKPSGMAWRSDAARTDNHFYF